MALFLDGTLRNDMDTSNFAHVIFQNVGKSYLPHAALECHYTLTQFIRPHPKDWVGIFKVNEKGREEITCHEGTDLVLVSCWMCSDNQIMLQNTPKGMCNKDFSVLSAVTRSNLGFSFLVCFVGHRVKLLPDQPWGYLWPEHFCFSAALNLYCSLHFVIIMANLKMYFPCRLMRFHSMAIYCCINRSPPPGSCLQAWSCLQFRNGC